MRTDLPERLFYSRDMSVHEGPPDAIAFAKTADEVSKILKLAKACFRKLESPPFSVSLYASHPFLNQLFQK